MTDTNQTGQTGTMGTEAREVPAMQMRELLQKDDEITRACSNPVWIGIFWVHFIAMCVLIALSLMESDEASEGVLSFFTDTLLGDGAGRKILGSMLGCAITGGLWSFLWVRFLQCFKDNPIKVALYLYHLLVAAMIGVALWQDYPYILYFYGVQLVFTDFFLYLNRDTFVFTESLLRVGLGAVVNNSKMQCVAYAFMPIQIIVYIFWILGFVFCLAWKPDNWYFFMVLFFGSYNWVGYFFNFIVHTFVTVLSGFWLMGLESGYGKASKSCKMAFTTSMGPIAFASCIMGILASIKAVVSNAIRIASCFVCYQCMYAACCGWLERIIARYNEYVLAYVALMNIEFGAGSRRLVALFERTGMGILVNEIGWDVALTVGSLLGFCVSGGIGCGLHIILWGDEFDATQSADVLFAFFCVYGLLGMSSTSVGLAPLRSALTTVFVIWAEEASSFARGQPEHYKDLMEAVEKCPRVKDALKFGPDAGQEKTV